jgi:hypothetical protein
MTTARVLSWDWRQQPDLDELARILADLSGGRLHLRQVETGSDEYAVVIADGPLSEWDAGRAYERARFGYDSTEVGR